MSTMNLFGSVDPTGGDGYAPGAWDEVRAAHLDGHITAEAYVVLREALCGWEARCHHLGNRPTPPYSDREAAAHAVRGCPDAAVRPVIPDGSWAGDWETP